MGTLATSYRQNPSVALRGWRPASAAARDGIVVPAIEQVGPIVKIVPSLSGFVESHAMRACARNCAIGWRSRKPVEAAGSAGRIVRSPARTRAAINARSPIGSSAEDDKSKYKAVLFTPASVRRSKSLACMLRGQGQPPVSVTNSSPTLTIAILPEAGMGSPPLHADVTIAIVTSIVAAAVRPIALNDAERANLTVI
jgi:hypothetical protein